MLDKLLFLIGLAGVAVVFADVLVRPGMLLEPVQRWARETYNYRLGAWQLRKQFATYAEALRTAQAFPRDLDSRWWWKPLWGCFVCVSGQWGFWGYLLYLGRHLAAGPNPWLLRYWLAYSLPEHLAFTAFTIIMAILLHKWTQN